MDFGTATFWGTIIAGVSGVIGVLCTKGIDALLKVRAAKHTEIQYADKKVVTGYEFVIASLKDQNDKLEAERKQQINQLNADLILVRGEHIDCVKVQEGLRVQNLAQQQDIESLQSEVKKLVAQVDKLRGTELNQQRGM